MTHHIYHTRGIILGSVSTGESNRFYKIFTEDLGLVHATAQSVREGKSKLRYVLQDFSFVTLDLVRGGEVWRITSAAEWVEISVIKSDTLRLKVFVRFCRLLSRLLQGEGREPGLFVDLIKLADFLTEQSFSAQLVPAIEALMALRAMVFLGYFNPLGYEVFILDDALNIEMLEKFEVIRETVLPKINDAIHASHL